MAATLAFCNDIDFADWATYREVHRVLDGEFGFAAEASFWLFEPAGGEMALFTNSVRIRPASAWPQARNDHAHTAMLVRYMPMLHHRPTRALNPISTILATIQVAKPARRLRATWTFPSSVRTQPST